ncbi:MAG TPA: tRNA-dihydrouridine synthase family protein [archaeon]|jgi:tRNA-dihydrouridine synthase B|nr:tRNA-dihydrouridine synthase family protein [archaeon]
MTAFKIGKVKIREKGVLAPMLEYTNLSFRRLCVENDCALPYTEMVHINQILNCPLEKIQELKTEDEDYFVSLQLVGDFTDTKKTISAFKKIENLQFKIIDFNLGCPSPKIEAGKSGAFLLDDIDKVSKTLKEIKSETDKSITAKVRLGTTKNNISVIAKSLENAGIDAIAIHGRLKTQGYKTPSDYKEVEKIAKELSIPVIYNGDINLNNYKTFNDIDVFSGLMIGRTALNNPEIFSLISEKKPKTREENIKLFINLSKKYNLEIKYQKNNLLQLVSGFSGSKRLREKLSIAKTQEDIEAVLY